MKSVVLSLLSLVVLLPTLSVPGGSSVSGIFVATTPCDAGSRLLLNLPENAGCELIKWDLKLYQQPRTLAPTTYKLTYTYGLPQQGTNGIAQGGTKVERKGEWTVINGTKSNAEAVIYRLGPDKHSESLSFQVVDDNVLHLSDRDGNLMVGNAGWSYTLNGTGDLWQHTQHPRMPFVSRNKPNAPIPAPATSDSPIVGTFVGRSPCREAARELNRDVNADCLKLKWELTLYQDPSTQTPTTYKLKGTLYRERMGEGRWTTTKGTKSNPEAVVYQLDPDKPQSSLFFMKADDSILFFLDKKGNLLKGNADFSYPLNRTNEVLKN